MPRNTPCRTLAVSAVFIAAVATASPSAACGYHGTLGDGFSALHSSSINVAIAIRDAADENLLDREIVAPKLSDLLALHRATARLQRLRNALQSTSADMAVPSFSLLLVESGMWSRYLAEEGRLRLAAHTDAPPAGEAVVVTGNAVLAAIGAGRLTVEDAMHRGLIVVDGPPELAQALAAAL